MTRVPAAIWLILVLSTLFPPTALGQSSQPTSLSLPAPTARALDQNVQQIAPCITVVYAWRNSSRLSTEEFARIWKQLPMHADWLINGRFEVRTTWQGNKFIETRIDQPWPTKVLKWKEANANSFDGETLYHWEFDTPLQDGEAQDEHATAYAIDNLPKRESKPDTWWINGSILHVMGYQVPGRLGDMKAKTPMRSVIRALLDEGGRVVAVDDVELKGNRVTRLRISTEDPEYRRAQEIDLEQYAAMLSRTAEPEERQRELVEEMRKRKDTENPDEITHTFWLDPHLNYAVRQYERHAGARLHWRHTCESFEKIPNRELFLPRKLIIADFRIGGEPEDVSKEPIKQTHYDVTEISFEKLPDDAFVPKIKTANCWFIDFRDNPENQLESQINEDGIPPRR